MSKHTPGPWEWYTSNSYNRLGTAHSGYCELLYPVVYKDGQPGIEWRNKADADLMAAAPDLKEALLDYMSQFGQALEANDIPFGPAQRAADAKARAAIAKTEPTP